MAASIARDLDRPASAAVAGHGTATDVPADLNRLLQRYETLLQATKDKTVTPELVAQAEAARAQVTEHVVLNLCWLLVGLGNFRAEPQPLLRTSSEPPSDQHLKLVGALQETIEVLMRTRRSFKSKALRKLREKLETLVEPRT